MNKSSLLFIAALAGCAQFQDRRSAAAPETHDVPVAARGDDEAPRTRALVLPFTDDRNAGVGVSLGELVRPAVTRDLARGGTLLIADPTELPAELRTPGPGGEYDLTKIAARAAPLGIGAVVEGRVMEVTVRRLGDTLGLIREARAKVTARVRLRINGGKAGKEIFRGERTTEVESSAMFVADQRGTPTLRDDTDLTRGAVARAFALVTPEALSAVQKLSWQGRVASIAGERVFLNAGRLTGLQVGDILKITEEGDDIYDPDTGRFIGTAPGRLKGTVEVVSYFGKDGAIAVIHSGSGFRENDRVELY